MRARCSVFIATSLDGFIARGDGSIDWLNEMNQRIPAGEDCGFGAFLASVDGLVLGRHSFEQALSFAEWPYGALPVFVMSRTLTSLPGSAPARVSLTREEPEALVARLSGQGHRHLYVDGGVTIQGFLQAGLIEELTITLIPVLLGTGKPLFGPLASDLQLAHLAIRVFDFGFVQNRYRIIQCSGAAGNGSLIPDPSQECR